MADIQLQAFDFGVPPLWKISHCLHECFHSASLRASRDEKENRKTWSFPSFIFMSLAYSAAIDTDNRVKTPV